MIHVHNHRAMATVFQVRIAGEETTYAAEAARAAFAEADRLESHLSRFRDNSDIGAIARLQPGESLRVTEPACACLNLGREMEAVTEGAFSLTAMARLTQTEPPRWSLQTTDHTVKCEAGRLEIDLGAIGKGFALDRMALELAEWGCRCYLLIAGGSSILAGEAPPGALGWSVGLGDDNSEPRYWLKNGSLSGSGISVKGRHILDPRTGSSADRRPRAWAAAPGAAVSDALSTALMVLDEPAIVRLMTGRSDWQAFLQDHGTWRELGDGKILSPAA